MQSWDNMQVKYFTGQGWIYTSVYIIYSNVYTQSLNDKEVHVVEKSLDFPQYDSMKTQNNSQKKAWWNVNFPFILKY